MTDSQAEKTIAHILDHWAVVFAVHRDRHVGQELELAHGKAKEILSALKDLGWRPPVSPEGK